MQNPIQCANKPNKVQESTFPRLCETSGKHLFLIYFIQWQLLLHCTYCTMCTGCNINVLPMQWVFNVDVRHYQFVRASHVVPLLKCYPRSTSGWTQWVLFPLNTLWYGTMPVIKPTPRPGPRRPIDDHSRESSLSIYQLSSLAKP